MGEVEANVGGQALLAAFFDQREKFVCGPAAFFRVSRVFPDELQRLPVAELPQSDRRPDCLAPLFSSHIPFCRRIENPVQPRSPHDEVFHVRIAGDCPQNVCGFLFVGQDFRRALLRQCGREPQASSYFSFSRLILIL
ncbi:hypothetical protein [Brevibacillus borstelensis]|uniref:hypothetical protein n=1 Tax=Brevibacillus borstelensis TaxID=45462 RepID=UPI003D217C56